MFLVHKLLPLQIHHSSPRLLESDVQDSFLQVMHLIGQGSENIWDV